MKKPTDTLEAQFNKNGIFFLEDKSIHGLSYEGTYLGVHVEIAVLGVASAEAPDFAISMINKRDVALIATDWSFIEREGQRILSFEVFQRAPDGVQLPSGDHWKRMSFLDLCFWAGNEKVPEVYGEDIETKLIPGSQAQDLGWILPSRFVDALIDALGALDNTVLGSNIGQALVYGPIVVEKGIK